jgi:hypothetical protein
LPGEFPALWYLDASQNRLQEFHLPKTNKLKEHLYLQKNELYFPPQEIAEQGAEAGQTH